MNKIQGTIYIAGANTTESGIYQLLCANCNWIKRDTENECYKQKRKYL